MYVFWVSEKCTKTDQPIDRFDIWFDIALAVLSLINWFPSNTITITAQIYSQFWLASRTRSKWSWWTRNEKTHTTSTVFWCSIYTSVCILLLLFARKAEMLVASSLPPPPRQQHRSDKCVRMCTCVCVHARCVYLAGILCAANAVVRKIRYLYIYLPIFRLSVCAHVLIEPAAAATAAAFGLYATHSRVYDVRGAGVRVHADVCNVVPRCAQREHRATETLNWLSGAPRSHACESRCWLVVGGVAADGSKLMRRWRLEMTIARGCKLTKVYVN